MEAITGTSIAVSIGVTLVIGGGAAILTGQAIAGTWRPVWAMVLACLGLGLADRFLVFALFQGPLFLVSGYLFDTAVLMAIGLAAWRLFLVANMVRQYPWLYERTVPWSYRSRRG